MNDRREFIQNLTDRMLEFSAQIIYFIDTVPRDISGTILSRQLLRAATSVGANFVEAQAASSKKDFSNFISIALKSANETKYWLALYKKVRKGNDQLINNLQQETIELANILGSIVKSARARQ